MEKITFKTYEQLFDFIGRRDISVKHAQHIVEKMIRMWFDKEYTTKKELIKVTEEVIEKWGHKPLSERPLFLDA